VKTRQFHRLHNLPAARRFEMLSEGLDHLHTQIERFANELDRCGTVDMVQASVLLRSVAREEAGKFFILVDSCRTDQRNHAAITDHLRAAGQHLPKLIAAQVADYSIGSQQEMLGAIDLHRQQYHLDGPNGADFIMPNFLTTERENALYVDLVDYDGELEWVGPDERLWGAETVPKPVRLVLALHQIGVTTPPGLELMNEVWSTFDPTANTNNSHWAALNASFVERLDPDSDPEVVRATIRHWPRPLVGLDIGLNKVDLTDLKGKRALLKTQLV
jgi:AbiV family abortive infection protein